MKSKTFKRSSLALAITAALAGHAAHGATITVDSLVDDGNGCTLRNAIQSANTNAAVGTCTAGDPGLDTIEFDPSLLPGTITLASGELTVGVNFDEPVNIVGPGADQLTVDGNAASRVMTIADGIQVSISGLTIQNGLASDFGGGINVATGSLTLSNSVVTGNTVQADNADIAGAGIRVDYGALNLINSTVSGNVLRLSPDVTFHEFEATGAGIHIVNGSATISDSTIAGNTIVLTDDDNLNVGDSRVRGGGIHIFTGSLSITNSSVTGNSVAVTSNARSDGNGARGGGIFNADAVVSITDSEISGNSLSIVTNSPYDPFGGAEGGGVYVDSGALTLLRTNVTGNLITSLNINEDTDARWDSRDVRGGGIFVDEGSVEVTDSIVSGNTITLSVAPGAFGANDTYGDAEGGGIYVDDGTLVFTNSTLSDNAAINNTSPNYNYSSDAHGGGLYLDNGTATLTNAVISGNTAAVYSNGILSWGDPEGGGIFADDGTLYLTNSVVTGNRALAIISTSRDAPDANTSHASGGGVYLDDGFAVLDNVLIADNLAQLNTSGTSTTGNAKGGGVYVDEGTMVLINSTISSNSVVKSGSGDVDASHARGGGVYFRGYVGYFFLDDPPSFELDGILSIVNSTISGNLATADSTASNVIGRAEGGGVHTREGTLTLLNSTLWDNSVSGAQALGGGLLAQHTYDYAYVGVDNTILAGSTGADCVLDNTTNFSASHSLFEDTGAAACGIANGADDNIVGSSPLLAPLADNGCITPVGLSGSTQCTPTHALLPDSPALDTADADTCAHDPVDGRDQRGFVRQAAACDIGAFEFSFSINASLADSTSVLVGWTLPPGFDTSGASSCTTYASPGGATCTAPAGENACVIGGLDPLTEYSFTVSCSEDGGDVFGSAARVLTTGAGSPTAIPSLSVWGMTGSAALLALFGMWRQRWRPTRWRL